LNFDKDRLFLAFSLGFNCGNLHSNKNKPIGTLFWFKTNKHMGKIIWILVAFLAGAFIPMQGGVNAFLGKEVKSPMHASLFSFAIGTIILLLYVILTKQTVSWEGVKSAPWFAWLGGFLGAYCLTAILFSFPRLGPGLTFGLVVAGQMIISVALEHFNILVAQPHPITLPRILGIVLMVGGVILIRLF
jgi:transporter family-2 protein